MKDKGFVPEAAGVRTKRALSEMREKVKSYDLSDLSEYPLALLKERVSSAIYNVEYYQKLTLEMCDPPLEDAEFLEWFARFPISGRPELDGVEIQRRFSSQWKDCQLVEKRTSGSTGVPFTLFIDEALAFFRSWRFRKPHVNIGGDSEQDLVFLFPKRFRTNKRIAKGQQRKTREGAESSYSNIVNAFQPSDLLFQELQLRSPLTIIGFASVIAKLSRWMIETNNQLHSIKGVWTTSESLMPEDALNIESAFGVMPCPIYASNEFGFIGYKQTLNGPLLLDTDRLFIELKQTEDMPDYGHVIITDLLNDVMPLIRYNTGDLAPMEAQNEASSLDTLPNLLGKQADIISTSSNIKVTPFQVLGCVREHLSNAQYRFVCLDVDNYVVQYVPGKAFKKHSKENLISALVHILGPEANIRLHETDKISREPSGKLRPVINLSNVDADTRETMIEALKLNTLDSKHEE